MQFAPPIQVRMASSLPPGAVKLGSGVYSRPMRTLPLLLVALLAAVSAVSAAPAALPALPAAADVENNLVFRRQDGETIVFAATARTFVWCGAYDEGEVETPTLHVITYDTTLTSGRYWRLWAIPADVAIGEPQSFPNPWTWPNPDSVEIFVGDPPNEASTDTGDAAGSITFQQLDCSEGGGVEFTIDARIGSEFGDGPWITVEGSFRATLTGSPLVPARGSTWGAVKATYR